MSGDYNEYMAKKRRQDAVEEATRESTLNGAATGALYGGVGRMLTGARRPGDILKAAALGAATYGPLAGGTTALGSKALGAPEDEDAGAFTTRGLVGGLLGGGVLGAAGGALLGSGRLRGLAKLPFAGKVAKVAEKELPLDNLIVDKIKHWAKHPGAASSAKSAALLAAVLGTGAAGVGASEGMQLDYLRNAAHDEEGADNGRYGYPP